MNRRWDELAHHRDRRGRFARSTGGGDWAGQVSARIAGEDNRNTQRQTRQPDWADKLSGQAGMTNEALAERFNQVTDLIDRHMYLATHRVHKPDGRWTDERAQAHREIVDKVWERYRDVPAERKAILVGGLPGAGKTTTMRSTGTVDPNDYVQLNPDDMKAELAERGMVPEVPGHPDLTPMERATLFHIESSYLTEMLAQRAYDEGKNVIWDVSMGDSGPAVRRAAEMRDLGYSIDGLFVHVPPEVSLQRAQSRYALEAREYAEDSKGYGGRPIPQHLILGMATGDGGSYNRDNFYSVLDIFDDWQVYDNTGSAPRLIERR
jgi:predicted kinase